MKKYSVFPFLVFGLFVFILFSPVYSADFEQDLFWSRNNDTIVLTNTSHNVYIGENETTNYRLRVNGTSYFNNNMEINGSLLVDDWGFGNIETYLLYCGAIANVDSVGTGIQFGTPSSEDVIQLQVNGYKTILLTETPTYISNSDRLVAVGETGSFADCDFIIFSTGIGGLPFYAFWYNQSENLINISADVSITGDLFFNNTDSPPSWKMTGSDTSTNDLIWDKLQDNSTYIIEGDVNITEDLRIFNDSRIYLGNYPFLDSWIMWDVPSNILKINSDNDLSLLAGNDIDFYADSGVYTYGSNLGEDNITLNFLTNLLDSYIMWSGINDEFIIPDDITFEKNVDINEELNVVGNATFRNEIKGDLHTLSLGYYRSTVLGFAGTLYLYSHNVLHSGSKGYVMIRSGSITGVSIMYDVTAQSGTPDLEIRVTRNGVSMWANDLDETVASNKVAYFTANRGSYSFGAGNDVTVYLYNNGGLGSSVTVDDIIVTLEFITN